MKYVITKNTLKHSIERYLKESFPEIVSVNFKTKSVLLASDGGRKIERNVIEVIADPFNAREFNKLYNYSDAKKLKSKIWNSLDSIFGLGFEEYGSEWDMDYFIIKIEKM